MNINLTHLSVNILYTRLSIRSFLRLLVVLLLGGWGIVLPCSAVTINTTWNWGSTPVDDPNRVNVTTVWGSVMNYYASTFQESYAGEQWNITVSWAALPGTQVANAGPGEVWKSGAELLTLSPGDSRIRTGVSYSGTLANHLAKSEVVAGTHIELNLNSGVTWDFSTTSKAVNTESLYTTMIHEIGHGLGFLSLIDSGTGAYQGGAPSIFDYYLAQGGTSLINMATDADRKAATTSGGVFWTGQYGLDANGSPFKIYAPDPYEDGSSMSHLDFSVNTSQSLIMFPSDSASDPNFSYSETELGMWRDLGYDVVPEPSTWMLVIVGSGMLLCLRGRREAKA